MLYQPTNITPSMLGEVGEGIVDITNGLTVSWQVNGNTPMTAFCITIEENNEASTQVATTNIITANCPFVGYRQDGSIVPFSYTISPQILTGLTFGNEYKLTIQQFWGVGEYLTDETQSVTQSSPSVFQVKNNPTLSITNIPETLEKYNNEFIGAYSQEQGVPVAASRWQVCVKGNEENPLKDTGLVYGYSTLRFFYDGFLSGYTYGVRLTVENTDGIIISTDWEYFDVYYRQEQVMNLATATCQKALSGIEIQFPQIANIEGVPSVDADYTIANHQLAVYDGAITWNERNNEPINFNGDWSVFWSGHLQNVFQATTLFNVELTNEYRLESSYSIVWLSTYGFTPVLSFTLYDENNTQVGQSSGFTYTPILVDDVEVLFSYLYKLDIAISSNGTIGVQCYYNFDTPVLYPNTNLYPSNTLYPLGNESGERAYYRSTTLFNLNIPYLTNFCGISVGENTTTNYISVVKQVYTANQIETIFNEQNPDILSWQNQNVYLLANFQNGLYAGNTEHEITGYAIYRREIVDGTLTFVANTSLTDTGMVDNAVENGELVQYYLFGIGDDVFTDILVTNTIALSDWAWTILVCNAIGDDTYSVEAIYTFKDNLSSGTMTNNGNVNILYNFTRYPTLQIAPYNFKSGTLKSLIGAVHSGVYSDSISLQDSIYALSTTTKQLFLKNRKGELLKVKVGGAITMSTEDNVVSQALTTSIPWIESGSAENSSITITHDNSLYPTNEV